MFLFPLSAERRELLRNCWTMLAERDIEMTDPSDRNRYEQAVATAWSSGEAFATRTVSGCFQVQRVWNWYILNAISVVVTPMPFPNAHMVMPMIIIGVLLAMIPENTVITTRPITNKAYE